MIFQFDEEMIETCLKANGWTYGWQKGRWVNKGINPDYCDYSMKEAFSIHLKSVNLYGTEFERGWKIENGMERRKAH